MDVPSFHVLDVPQQLHSSVVSSHMVLKGEISVSRSSILGIIFMYKYVLQCQKFCAEKKNICGREIKTDHLRPE